VTKVVGPRDARNRELADLWRWFAQNQFRGYSPIYQRIAEAVADDDELLDLVRAAPPAAHLPLVLLAAAHFLLLQGYQHPLAEVYAGRYHADPAPLFLDLCQRRRDDMAALLATRHTQTNECGRSAVLGPALTWLASSFDRPLALVDAGASAGLNLVCDRYHLDYGERGATGPAQSTVKIDCRVVGGDPPIAAMLPPLVARMGVDRSPVDLTNPDDARWLLACVWPDTGRLGRTEAAIRLAQQDLPVVVAGDVNEALPAVLRALPAGAVAVVVTTWAFAYLSIEQRGGFLRLLEAESHHRTVAWLSAEGIGTVSPLADAVARTVVPQHDHTDANVLGAVIFEGGEYRPHLLGFVHQHGSWIDWRATGADSSSR